MKPKEILVFGASGQIGRHLIRKFTKNNYKVFAVTRNIHKKGYILKTQANPGYLEVGELKSIGILYEKSENQFHSIHSDFPDLLSKLCKRLDVEQFIHLSSLGIEDVSNSEYAKSKISGEHVVKKNFNKSIILKPSICYSVDDNFTTRFLTLLRLTQPIYLKKELSMKTDIIFTVLTPNNINTSNKLQLLSKISSILNRNNIKKKITGIKRAEDVLAILMNA